MTAYSGQAFLTQHEKSTEQIKELLQAFQNITHKLEEVQQERLLAEEEIVQCTREMERRVCLIMDKSEVVDVLQQLGHLLHEQRQLSEQLNEHASANRKQDNDLQERSECVTHKARRLAAEILEVKQCLAEAKTRNMAAQALIHAPTSKPKRNQNKPK